MNKAQEPVNYKNGTIEWVQIVDRSSFVTEFSDRPANFDNQSGLDKTYPYLARSNEDTQDPVDSPGENYDTTVVTKESISGTLTMFLLWMPPAAVGQTDWVPLQKLTWSFSATATYDAAKNKATITSQSSTPMLGSRATGLSQKSLEDFDYPTWSHVAI